MSGIQAICMTLCYTCVAVSMITVLIPQKRTRRVMSFVVGLFFISTFITAASAQISEIDLRTPDINEIPIPTYKETDPQDAVAQMTAGTAWTTRWAATRRTSRMTPRPTTGRSITSS